MSETVIHVENLSKQYQLGVIGSGALYRDLQSWWAQVRGKEDPNSRIGQWDTSRMEGGQRFWALRNLSLEVKQGEVLGIIGRNGAGKSTLLKILSRVTGPTSGRVRIKGRVASLLEVGTGFHPELTGRENIFLNGSILGMRETEIKTKFDEIVDFAEIKDFIDTPVKRYSSGMYTRLAFAVAAHLDPEILIVDEVLAVGDAEFQNKCLSKMKDVSGTGRTVLFVSHNMGAIQALCSRACLLEAGKLVMFGTPDEAVSKYFNKTLNTPESRDLSVRKDRSGSCALKLMRFNIFDSDRNLMEVIPCGKKVCFELKFKVSAAKISNLRFGISVFESDTGKYVTEFNSYYRSSKMLSCEQGSYNFVFTIDKLPLAPGQYNLNFIATSGLEVLDWLTSACQITVSDGLFYESGRMPLPGSFPIFFSDFEMHLIRDEG